MEPGSRLLQEQPQAAGDSIPQLRQPKPDTRGASVAQAETNPPSLVSASGFTLLPNALLHEHLVTNVCTLR